MTLSLLIRARKSTAAKLAEKLGLVGEIVSYTTNPQLEYKTWKQSRLQARHVWTI